jgi:hypothetical protein
MKSRLKELKDNHEFRKGEGWEITTLSEDVDWLIEQAEKVEVIKEEIKGKWSTEMVSVNRLHQILDK